VNNNCNVINSTKFNHYKLTEVITKQINKHLSIAFSLPAEQPNSIGSWLGEQNNPIDTPQMLLILSSVDLVRVSTLIVGNQQVQMLLILSSVDLARVSTLTVGNQEVYKEIKWHARIK
jgi:hypothetical protein